MTTIASDRHSCATEALASNYCAEETCYGEPENVGGSCGCYTGTGLSRCRAAGTWPKPCGSCQLTTVTARSGGQGPVALVFADLS
jgi:hypothetical protein